MSNQNSSSGHIEIETAIAAISFDEYVDVSPDSTRLNEVYGRTAFNVEEVEQLRALSGRLTIFAIVADGCVDVMANLPIVAKIAEIGSVFSLRILRRQGHRDIAGAYPAADGLSHVPTYIVRSEDGQDRGVLIERPPAITATMLDYVDAMKTDLAAQQPGIVELLKTDEGRSRVLAEMEGNGLATRLNDAFAYRSKLHDAERRELVDWFANIAQEHGTAD